MWDGGIQKPVQISGSDRDGKFNATYMDLVNKQGGEQIMQRDYSDD